MTTPVYTTLLILLLNPVSLYSSYRPTRVTYYIVNKPLSQIIISKLLSIKLILHSMYFVPIFSLLYFFVTVVYIYTFSLCAPYPTD